MRQVIRRFLKHLDAEKNASATTIETYRYDLYKFDLYLVKRLGNRFLPGDVSRDHIRDYLIWLSEVGHQKPNGLSARARALAAIRSFFKYAHRAGLLRDNPAADIALPKIRMGEIRALSQDECGRLLRVVETNRSPFIILTESGEPQANAGDYEAAARAFNVTILPMNISGPKPDLESAFQAAVRGGAKAMIVNRDAVTASYLKQVAEQAIKHRLPSMNEDRAYVEAGGLRSYGTNDAAQFQRAAYYVDRILKGAKPADLPVERPTKFEFIINLKTAKQIGLTIPPNVLARADKVIR